MPSTSRLTSLPSTADKLPQPPIGRADSADQRSVEQLAHPRRNSERGIAWGQAAVETFRVSGLRGAWPKGVAPFGTSSAWRPRSPLRHPSRPRPPASARLRPIPLRRRLRGLPRRPSPAARVPGSVPCGACAPQDFPASADCAGRVPCEAVASQDCLGSVDRAASVPRLRVTHQMRTAPLAWLSHEN